MQQLNHQHSFALRFSLTHCMVLLQRTCCCTAPLSVKLMLSLDATCLSLPCAVRLSLTQVGRTEEETQVLDALRKIIDPDFGEDIVKCGFIKRLQVCVGERAFGPRTPGTIRARRSAKCQLWWSRASVGQWGMQLGERAQSSGNRLPLQQGRAGGQGGSCKGFSRGLTRSCTSWHMAAVTNSQGVSDSTAVSQWLNNKG